ncbi:uncharacterized protein EV420DRAFT_1769426 [Desarmillaria tabescens]|uniref:F-box domain-containing protein n=1 Tax=Armillaria tabescens TaxID=1929756 RepID=A0AA39JB36_ARMTA|nr:uncharacterized protein EV420DRAFT_1769426 [Desarmillaria tabescens]KAK0439506.1 hypothetical protein EV420DRAFT_1769426 [Desarmillaria tabescens]
MSILALPPELLEKITFQVGCRGYQAMRSTCRVLCDVATPFVFENLHINFEYIESHRSEAKSFLKELSNGRRLARFVRSIHFQSTMMHRRPKIAQVWNAITLLGKQNTFYRTVGNLLLAAVPLMQSLEYFWWGIYDQQVVVDRVAMKDIIHRLSALPRLEFVAITSWKIKQEIPCAPFHHLTSLLVSGRGTLDYVPPIIANSPKLLELDVTTFRYDHPSPPHFPVVSLFSAFPEGEHSSLLIMRLSGNYFNLDPSTVPVLIPHLRKLVQFHVPIGFEIPDEFWSGLLAARVYFPRVSCSSEGLGDSFLTYLGSYHGLKELKLWPFEPNAQDDERHSRFLLHHIIPTHAISLTDVTINPRYAGPWCFDASMCHSLSFCMNLEHLAICVDEERAPVTGPGNVVVTLMKSLKHWPFLKCLTIETVVSVEAGIYVRPNQSPQREVCARVQDIVTMQYRNPTLQMLALRINTDFVYGFKLRRSELPGESYSFYSDHLSYWGERLSKDKE